jgi:hypothetical protein
MTRLATKIRSLERCLFCLVFALSLHANSSTGAETERIQEIPSAFAPYWYVDESTDSFIQVKKSFVDATYCRPGAHAGIR